MFLVNSHRDHFSATTFSSEREALHQNWHTFFQSHPVLFAITPNVELRLKCAGVINGASIEVLTYYWLHSGEIAGVAWLKSRQTISSIDSVAQEDFYELLAKFRNEQDISVIMVSHDIGVITSHADRVACLNVQLHYHDEPDSCFSPDITKKVFGKDLKVIVHDDKCATCYHRHQDHD